MVYPNPGEGQFTLSSPGEIANVEIFNVLGERVFSSDGARAKFKDINITKSGPGIYFAIVYDGALYYNNKIIVK